MKVKCIYGLLCLPGMQVSLTHLHTVYAANYLQVSPSRAAFFDGVEDAASVRRSLKGTQRSSQTPCHRKNGKRYRTEQIKLENRIRRYIVPRRTSLS